MKISSKIIYTDVRTIEDLEAIVAEARKEGCDGTEKVVITGERSVDQGAYSTMTPNSIEIVSGE